MFVCVKQWYINEAVPAVLTAFRDFFSLSGQKLCILPLLAVSGRSSGGSLSQDLRSRKTYSFISFYSLCFLLPYGTNLK
jgi:hypothetical protein